MKVLELKDVTKSYRDFTLDHVSFDVEEGGICGFIGQNGAGKTTTLQLILDIVRKDSGEIRLFGKSVEDKEALISCKQDIGVVYDEMGFHDFMTPLQIGRMMELIYQNWDGEAYRKYLGEFGLPPRKSCGRFSRGMRMKLQIAVAMSHHAGLLIMDEPTSGLDPIVRNEILQIFQEFVREKGHTILMSSHITGDLERIADEVVFIDKGKIILAGGKDEILRGHKHMGLEDIFISYVNRDRVNQDSVNKNSVNRDRAGRGSANPEETPADGGGREQTGEEDV